ncbi:MAG: DNA polymerase IV [Candidatus Thiodiazotropha sp.]
MPQRLIMHIDLDAFFASIEQRDHPEYQGRPVVVGAKPGKRGVVATCSYEARRYGVRSAMPINQAARRLPPETVYLHPRIARYGEVSRQIMSALENVSPLVEPVSIDEAFLDVSGMERLVGSPELIGRKAKRLIQEAVELGASVGIGPNRLIAKLASDYRKPDGLTIVLPDQVQAFLDPQPLSVLRGLGAKSASILQRLGLRSVADVRRLSLLALRQHLGERAGSKIHEQARGIASDRIERDTARKSISKETTFNQDINDPALLRDTLRWAAQEVGYRARREDRKGSLVTLKVRFHGFETHTRNRKLAVPTSADMEIFRHAWRLFQAQPWSGRPIRLIGLGISGWETGFTGDNGQGELFNEMATENDARQDLLYETLDAVGEKFGRKSVRMGIRQRKR